MEGKKIAFIVVAIAAVGGIAYYLNKKVVQTTEVAKTTVFSSKEEKDKASAEASARMKKTALQKGKTNSSAQRQAYVDAKASGTYLKSLYE